MRGSHLDQAREELRVVQERVDRLTLEMDGSGQAGLAAVCAALKIDKDSDIETIIREIATLQRGLSG